MRIILSFAILFFSPAVFAQDLTGTWEGPGHGLGTEYAKLVIIKCGDKWVGYSYDEGPGFCQANFEGEFNEVTKRLTGESQGMIRKSADHTQSRFDLHYSVDRGHHYLEGIARPKSAIFQIFSFGIGAGLRLRRTSTKVDTTAFMRGCLVDLAPVKIDSPQVRIDPPKEEKIEKIRDSITMKDVVIKPVDMIEIKAARKNDTVATIQTAAPTIRISLYDNGQIDGDTITVFHNNRVIADHLGVTAKPYQFTIEISREKPVHEIVFVANNLGSIPPNTAVLIIEAGNKKYTLFASTDLSRNSMVRFEFSD